MFDKGTKAVFEALMVMKEMNLLRCILMDLYAKTILLNTS